MNILRKDKYNNKNRIVQNYKIYTYNILWFPFNLTKLMGTK